MSFSNYLEAAILDHIFDEASYTAPTWYVALFVGDPGEAGAGGTEVSGNNYARTALGATTRTDNSVVNDAAVEFPEASGSWGTIDYVALYDASTAGNFLGSVAVDSPLAVGSGATARFAAGTLEFTLD